MSLTAIGLILISAVLHAVWNFAGKRDRPTAALFLAATVMGGLCMLPVVIYFQDRYVAIPFTVWKLVLFTGVFQAFYFGMLAAAYREGDLSYVYPLARSLPTLLVTSLAILMGDGSSISRLCLVGIALIIVGCAVLPLRTLRNVQSSNYLNVCSLFASMAAIGIAGYMFIDKAALSDLCNLNGTPFTKTAAALVYAPLEVCATAFWLSIYVLLRTPERQAFLQVLRTRKTHAWLMGVGIYGAYVLVLLAMNFSGHVSYVMAFRQLSIPLAAALGMLALNEPRPYPKALGVASIVSGVVLVGLG